MTPDRQCTATAKATRVRCLQPAIVGGSVCWKHGGAAPQVRAAANRNAVKAKADGEVASLLEAMAVEPGADRGQVLLELIDAERRMVGVLEFLVGRLGLTPRDDNGELREAIYGPDHLGDLRPHPVTAMLRQHSDDLARHIKLAHDIGIDERLARVAEQQVDVVATALLATLRKLDVGVDESLVLSTLDGELRALDVASVETSGPSTRRVPPATLDGWDGGGAGDDGGDEVR